VVVFNGGEFPRCCGELNMGCGGYSRGVVIEEGWLFNGYAVLELRMASSRTDSLCTAYPQIIRLYSFSIPTYLGR
jgi:hypothetical protein